MRYVMKPVVMHGKFAVLVILTAGICATTAAARPQPGQQTKQSVAEAARKAQAKEKNAAKAKTVWTNDNIPNSPGGLSIVGQAAAPEGESSTREAAPAPQNSEELAGDRDKVSSDLAEAKKELDSLKTDLDLLQREHNLDAAQLYSTPDYTKDQSGQAKVDIENKAIAAKQQAVDAAQKKVDDLEKQAKSPGEKEKTPTATPATKPQP